MKYTILFITLIIIVWYFFFRIKHKFWDRQPVSRNNLKKEGIISNVLPKPIKLRSPIEVIKIQSNDKTFQKFLPSFLNNHYISEYTYDTKYIEWFFTFPNLKATTINHTGKIVGTIINKPYNVKMGDDTIYSHYVDMLSIHTEHRKKNYASLLMSNTIQITSNNLYKTYIFKTENKTLPYNHFCKSKYYIFNIEKSFDTNPQYSLSPSTNKDIEYIRDLYHRESKKYKCYPILDTEQEEYIFTSKNGVYESLIIKVDDIPKGVVTYVVNFIENKNLKRAEIVLLLCEDVNYINVVECLINHCKKYQINELICIDMAQNNQFIYNMSFRPGMDVYFYMYNYHLNKQIKSSDILFNYV